jgi:hypothetical protein
MRALAFLVGALALSAATRPARRDVKSRGFHHAAIAVPDLEPVLLPPVSVPAVAAGAFALGALAVGALAIGALAIGRLEIRQARLRKVEIDDLIVRKLHILEEPVVGEDLAAPDKT